MDWLTLGTSLLGSSVLAAIVTNILNEKTQIKAIKESGIYAKRAEVLDELIKKIEKTHLLARNLISPYKTSDQENHQLFEFIDEFEKYYVNTRHYLPTKVAKEIDRLNTKYLDVYTDVTNDKFVYKIKRKKLKDTEIERWTLDNLDYMSALDTEKEKIINEFRKIIGVK